jgi:hypothetical protein
LHTGPVPNAVGYRIQRVNDQSFIPHIVSQIEVQLTLSLDDFTVQLLGLSVLTLLEKQDVSHGVHVV